MTEMLTAKEMQELLHVDRSTIYRMAESGRLPAIKVGKQWRFPADQIEGWFQVQINKPNSSLISSELSDPVQKDSMYSGKTDFLNGHADNLAQILPLDCVQLIQDTFADLLGVMLVITDMDGVPITQPSNPCGLFQAISINEQAVQKCIQSWQSLSQTIDLEPQFSTSHLGLLCTRAMVRVGVELKGMVVAGCVAPESWPPSSSEIRKISEKFEVADEIISDHIDEVFHLDEARLTKVLTYMQRIANIVAHIVHERQTLMGRLEAIADLTKFLEE